MVRTLPLPSGEARERAERAARLLAADGRVRLVFLFGSAADPARKTVRDVDLALLTDPVLSLAELLRLRADLALAVGEGLDLVSLNHAPVVLAHEIAETGRCLYEAAPGDAAEFVARTLMRYWDFLPYLREQWRVAGERLAERRLGRPA